MMKLNQTTADRESIKPGKNIYQFQVWLDIIFWIKAENTYFVCNVYNVLLENLACSYSKSSSRLALCIDWLSKQCFGHIRWEQVTLRWEDDCPICTLEHA